MSIKYEDLEKDPSSKVVVQMDPQAPLATASLDDEPDLEIWEWDEWVRDYYGLPICRKLLPKSAGD